jgi:hypothetical protein
MDESKSLPNVAGPQYGGVTVTMYPSAAANSLIANLTNDVTLRCKP